MYKLIIRTSLIFLIVLISGIKVNAQSPNWVFEPTPAPNLNPTPSPNWVFEPTPAPNPNPSPTTQQPTPIPTSNPNPITDINIEIPDAITGCTKCPKDDFTKKNFLNYAKEVFSNKFPFDTIGNIPNGSTGVCGEKKEVCTLKETVENLLRLLKYPVWIGFLLTLVRAI